MPLFLLLLGCLGSGDDFVGEWNNLLLPDLRGDDVESSEGNSLVITGLELEIVSWSNCSEFCEEDLLVEVRGTLSSSSQLCWEFCCCIEDRLFLRDGERECCDESPVDDLLFDPPRFARFDFSIFLRSKTFLKAIK